MYGFDEQNSKTLFPILNILNLIPEISHVWNDAVTATKAVHQCSDDADDDWKTLGVHNVSNQHSSSLRFL